jgi:hypothetical protein
VVVDAEHRPLVNPATGTPLAAGTSLCLARCLNKTRVRGGSRMARGLLLWLLGVPIPVIILLWLFFGH